MRLNFTGGHGDLTGAHRGAPLRCELMMMEFSGNPWGLGELMMVELSGNPWGLGELMMVELPRRGGPLCPPGVLSLE
jgi:hypothetical protein